MADTNINLLPSTGAITPANFNSDISIACDVQVSPGTFITKKIPGDVLKNTLTSHITNLPTSSFTNIQTSINNIFTYFNNEVVNNNGYLNKGSVTPFMFYEKEITNHITNSFVFVFKVKLNIIDRLNSTTINNVHTIEKIFSVFKPNVVDPYSVGSPIIVMENSTNAGVLPALNLVFSGNFAQFTFPRNVTWDRQYSYTIELNKYLFV